MARITNLECELGVSTKSIKIFSYSDRSKHVSVSQQMRLALLTKVVRILSLLSKSFRVLGPALDVLPVPERYAFNFRYESRELGAAAARAKG